MKYLPSSLFAAAIALTLPFSASLEAVDYASSFTWDMTYDATLLPNSAGSVSYSNATTGAFGTVGTIANLDPSVSGGVLSLDTVNNAWYTLSTDQGRLFLDSTTGYTVEYRARVLSATNSSGSMSIAGGVLDMNDGSSSSNAYWALGFGADPSDNNILKVGLTGKLGEETYITINSDWITYSVTVLDDTATLYMDGIVMASTTVRDLAGTASRWGHLTASNKTVNFEVDSLKIYDGGAVSAIPEPGFVGAAVAALSFAVVLVRRRRC